MIQALAVSALIAWVVPTSVPSQREQQRRIQNAMSTLTHAYIHENTHTHQHAFALQCSCITDSTHANNKQVLHSEQFHDAIVNASLPGEDVAHAAVQHTYRGTTALIPNPHESSTPTAVQ
jgi:hypothetical protein